MALRDERFQDSLLQGQQANFRQLSLVLARKPTSSLVHFKHGVLRQQCLRNISVDYTLSIMSR